MTKHSTHNMKLTSLLVKFGNYTEAQYNSKFRNHIEKHILEIHSCVDGLTDEELGDILKIKLDLKTIDTNLYRPRRSDLSKEKRGKRGNLLRPSFLYDSGEQKLNKYGRLCVVWKLNPENLKSYMRG